MKFATKQSLTKPGSSALFGFPSAPLRGQAQRTRSGFGLEHHELHFA